MQRPIFTGTHEETAAGHSRVSRARTGVCVQMQPALNSTANPQQPPRSVFLSSSSNADEAQEAEAIQILTSILSIRESTSGKAPQKTVLVLKTLSMLYYLMLKCSKVSFPEKLSKWGGSRAEHLAVQVNYVLPATPGQAFTL